MGSPFFPFPVDEGEGEDIDEDDVAALTDRPYSYRAYLHGRRDWPSPKELPDEDVDEVDESDFGEADRDSPSNLPAGIATIAAKSMPVARDAPDSARSLESVRPESLARLGTSRSSQSADEPSITIPSDEQVINLDDPLDDLADGIAEEGDSSIVSREKTSVSVSCEVYSLGSQSEPPVSRESSFWLLRD